MSMSYRPGWLKFIYMTIIWPLEAVLVALILGFWRCCLSGWPVFVWAGYFVWLGPLTPGISSNRADGAGPAQPSLS